MFTKGEGGWEQRGSLIVAFGKEGAVICQMAEPHPKSGDAEYQSLELSSKGWDLQMANASLIIAAVNACQKVNKDNPQAVAEAIKPMYEALKQAQEGKGDWRGMIDLALALADGRVE